MKFFFKPHVLMVSVFCVLTACGGSGGGNRTPYFNQESYSFTLDEDTRLSDSVTASDEDGDVLSYVVSKSPLHGILSLNRDGSFSYIPNTNFFGDDTATIGVSDSIASAQVTLNFAIANVNDLPVISTASVAVSSNGNTTGQINVSDADADTLSFTVVTAPDTGTIALNAETGAFTYTAQTLEGVSGSFVVSVSDGVGEAVESTILLTASYVTNADKLSYYYSSAHSHLAKAEAYITVDGDDDVLAISDAEVSDEGYMQLAKGYAEAGFGEKAQTIITQNILSRTVKARAYLDSSSYLDGQGNTLLANTFRAASVTQYNTYLAEIGIANLSSSDAGFYNEVVKAYLTAGELEKASTLLATILVYSNEIKVLEGEESPAHRRFLTAAQSLVEAVVTSYLAAPADSGFENAVIALDYLTALTDSVSYNEVSNGVRYENWRANWYGFITRNAFLLSLVGSDAQKSEAQRLARTALGKLMSLYTSSVYDEEYHVTVSEYAANTLSRFPTGLANVAGVFAALYADYITANKSGSVTGNIPLDMVIAEEGMSDSDTKNAYRDSFAYQILVDVTLGRDPNTTISQLSEFFTSTIDDDRMIVEALIEQDNAGDIDKRAAWLLYYAGYQSEALALIQTALTTLQNEAYIEDINLSLTEMLGSQGCMRLAELAQEFGEQTASTEMLLSTCVSLVDTHYNKESTDSDDKLKAYAYAAIMNEQLGNQNAKLTALATALEVTADFEDIEDIIGYTLYVANTAATIGELNAADEILTALIPTINSKLTDTSSITDRVDLIAILHSSLAELYKDGTTTTFPVIYNLNTAVRYQAGINADYAAVKASVTQSSINLLDTMLAATEDFADTEKVSVYEDFIDYYSAIKQFDSAVALITSDLYVDADRDELLAMVTEYQASIDYFPASSIANIDTDNDGQPNFFLSYATDNDIAESVLSLDDDADNDGILDPEDLSPLDN